MTHPDNQRRKKPEVTSECVNPSVSKAKWDYGGQTYVVSGPESNGVGRWSVGFNKFVSIIKKIVDSAIPHDLPSLEEHEIYAFLNCFERAKEAGLVGGTGGIVTVDAFRNVASQVCENPSADSPFTCLDPSFIYILLHDGFGLDKTSNIVLRKYINGHEVSWALGAAFELLQNDV